MSPKGKPPEPVEPTVLAFDVAWSRAWKAADSLAAEEPEATKQALDILTAEERFDAGAEMREPDLSRSARSLLRKGFTHWVACQSHKVAKGDPEFRAVAERLWDAEIGTQNLLQMMNVWGTIPAVERIHVINAVKTPIPTARLDPAIRNVILLLGGEKWLRR